MRKLLITLLMAIAVAAATVPAAQAGPLVDPVEDAPCICLPLPDAE